MKQRTKDFGIIPIPPHLRHDEARPFHFGTVLNIAFGFASTFIQLSKSFNVSFDEVSRIPTLVQAGYATGLLLLSPLGDLVRRRQLILTVVALAACLTIGLSITSSLVVFEVLSFLVGVFTVTPQILVPLAADLAPPQRRASAISVVLSGLLFGILIARVLAGIIAEFTTWRVFVVLIGCYWMLPDYPSKNVGLSYWHILYTMAKFAVTEPILIQACLINMGSSACFSNFWVTLTFLLGASPYNYSTLVIGLFGLIGMGGVSLGPYVGKAIDRLVPWYASLFAVSMLTVFQAIHTGAGGVNVAAVIIATFGLDVFRQMLQVSLTTAIFSISLEARARLNAVSILSIFIGQVMGTSVGTKIFNHIIFHGLYGFQLCMLLLRGPHCNRFTWVGYEGGFEARRSVVDEKKRMTDTRTAESNSTEGDTIASENHAQDPEKGIKDSHEREPSSSGTDEKVEA
ncbi:major facilitator superfamily domain-containing protein [Cyathus striatus]|nr:major facilitator superfamily domain-containing protein [Cyathus striatus]